MKRGYFVISDISGYTDFMNQSELDHASEIISSSLENIVGKIDTPLKVSNFQGDAILMYAPDELVHSPQSLLRQIENIYFEFRRHIEKMRYNTQCTCKACGNMQGLDLKLFIHHGAYALQVLGDREELVGPDVILTHRLMKNDAIEKTGVTAYAMFTEAAATILPIEQIFTELINYSAEFGEQGLIDTRLLCLHTQWEKELRSDANRVTIPADETWVETQVQLTVSPSVAWNYITQAEHKKEWLGMDAVEHTPLVGSVYGNGSKYHCAHGEAGNFDYEVMDWRPFEYLTIDGIAPGNLVFRQMDTLHENDEGTLFSVKIIPRSKGFLHGLLNNRRARKMQSQYQVVYDMCHGGLRDYITQQESLKS